MRDAFDRSPEAVHLGQLALSYAIEFDKEVVSPECLERRENGRWVAEIHNPRAGHPCDFCCCGAWIELEIDRDEDEDSTHRYIVTGVERF